MLAQRSRGREWGILVLVSAGLLLSGCGGGNMKDLLKDSPTQGEDAK